MRLSRAQRQILSLVTVALAALVWWYVDHGDSTTPEPTTRSSVDRVSGLPLVSEADLPAQATETLQRIDDGGPFRYSRDGVVFENRERILPRQERGYYHEYTVSTPGESDRGARRIVTGSDDEFYWTPDHYQSFQRIQR